MKMKRVRVCNVDEEGRFGGPEKRIVNVGKRLEKYEVDTTVLLPKLESEDFQNYLNEIGVRYKIKNLTRLSLQKSILVRYLIKFPSEIIMLALHFKNHEYNLIHVNGSYQFKTAIAAIIAGKPAVWHLNDTKGRLILKTIFRTLIKFKNIGIITAGEKVSLTYLNENIKAEHPYKIIHAPVDTKIFDPKLHQKKEKYRFCKIGTVAGINPAKGIESFLEVAKLIVEKNKNVKFFIAGPILDSQLKYLESLKKTIKEYKLEKHINILGRIYDVPKFLADLDICLFTSVREASPTSIWEAMAMEKPIVTTNVGSVDKYIEDEVSGKIVETGNNERLAKAVTELINSKEKRIQFGKNARCIAKKNLSLDAAARLHKEVYIQTIEQYKKQF